jgi:IS30 family transposase
VAAFAFRPGWSDTTGRLNRMQRPVIRDQDPLAPVNWSAVAEERRELWSARARSVLHSRLLGRLPVLFPDRDDVRVSHETIYQALFVQGRGSLREELNQVKALRSSGTARLAGLKLPRRSSRSWLDGCLFTDRPAEVRDRAVLGHWEGNCVVDLGRHRPS